MGKPTPSKGKPGDDKEPCSTERSEDLADDWSALFGRPDFSDVTFRYIYTGKVELSNFKVDELLATLHLAHEYRLVKIQTPVIDALKVTRHVCNQIKWSPMIQGMR